MVIARKFIRTLKVIKHVLDTSYIVSRCRDWTPNAFVRYLVMMLVAPFWVCKYFMYRDVPGRKGIAFVLIAKNEAPYIEEWIKFHHKQGASHFIIYDNESEDNLHEVLTPYIESGLVTYRLAVGRKRQMDVYNIAIHDYGHKFKYMAVIDADEFLFVRKNIYGGGMTFTRMLTDS